MTAQLQETNRKQSGLSGALRMVKLDLLTVKPYLTFQTILILFLVGGVITWSMGNGTGFVVITMLAMYNVIFFSYPFAVGEKNGIDALYAVLCVPRGTVVLGRYGFALLLNGVICLLSCIVGVVMVATGMETDLPYMLGYAVGITFFMSLMETIQLPILFKLGYEKCRFLIYLPYFAFSGLLVLATTVIPKEGLNSLMAWISDNPVLLVFLVAAVWLGAIVLSCRISVAFYKKREF